MTYLNFTSLIIVCHNLEICDLVIKLHLSIALQFPFFCSDREYIIGRRIWESGKAYYCVTKVSAFCSFCITICMLVCPERKGYHAKTYVISINCCSHNLMKI